MGIHKAGWLVGLAGCCAARVLADNATFQLAVNRITAHRRHSAIITNNISSSRGLAGRASALNHEVVGSSLTWDKIFSHACAHFGCTRLGAELSSVGVGCVDNSKTAQPSVSNLRKYI